MEFVETRYHFGGEGGLPATGDAADGDEEAAGEI
jgi:hypothetical protein